MTIYEFDSTLVLKIYSSLLSLNQTCLLCDIVFLHLFLVGILQVLGKIVAWDFAWDIQ